jgi:hypothetical protein
MASISSPAPSPPLVTLQILTFIQFIRAGNPQLTAALKEVAKRDNRTIHAVTITPHAQRHELSREIHRVGYHFPSDVVAEVCHTYGIRITSKGELDNDSKDDEYFRRVYENKDAKPAPEKLDQVTINTEAQQNLTDLFPHIPKKDLYKSKFIAKITIGLSGLKSRFGW